MGGLIGGVVNVANHHILGESQKSTSQVYPGEPTKLIGQLAEIHWKALEPLSKTEAHRQKPKSGNPIQKSLRHPGMGDNLREYRPSRWLSSGLIQHEPLDALAYGHGSRICIGMPLANYTGLSECFRQVSVLL